MGRFINPVPQFLTSLGKPLSAGLLYFYETETMTPLDTYSDPELTTVNPNPIALDAAGRASVDIFLDGVYKVILKDSSGVTQWEEDPVTDAAGASREAFSTWRPTVAYNFGNITVGSDNNYYVSLQNNNYNHDPLSSPDWWERVEFLRYYNANVTYLIGEIVQDTTGSLWRSKQNANTGNTPSLNSAWWEQAVDSRFADVLTASSAIQKNQSYSVLATSAAVDLPIPVMTANDKLVVHNCMQSTQTVRLLNTLYTIRGKRGDAPNPSEIVLAKGDTAVLVARSATDLEAL